MVGADGKKEVRMAGWRGALIALTLIPRAALAQEAPEAEVTKPNLTAAGSGQPGGVAALTFAQRLFVLGKAQHDAQSVLSAARLARSVLLRETQMPKVVADETEASPASSAVPPDPAAMLELARNYAGNDETLLLLVDAAERETQNGGLTAAWSPGLVQPGQSERWSVPFFGAALAEIGVIGKDGATLDLRITDETNLTICQESGPADVGYCGWYPARNGHFTVTVTNTGTIAQNYVLLAN
ncbi:MAG: hypothetical protein DI533_13210 [Cereibacter sphaeroides]|uniref:Uncharacterized protein n=1 Tax=Cereibacter sphaeroides TaxID=1063 RepID=A0A2W5TLH4_CERSP|nr:MAG: hypothetical protein DI533_13210 [Cereibacter sphaeroides]